MQALDTLPFDAPRSDEATTPSVPDRSNLHPGTLSLRPADGRRARPNAGLLPTLFDRLRDDAPHSKTETDSASAISASQLREIIQRDLGLLLNVTNVEDFVDRSRYAEVAKSTLNYGVPPLAGSHITERKWVDIERLVRCAIADFEPRLIPGTVSVLPLTKDGLVDGGNLLLFEIRAMIQQEPYPLELMVQTSIDLETRRMHIAGTPRGPVRTSR